MKGRWRPPAGGSCNVQPARCRKSRFYVEVFVSHEYAYADFTDCFKRIILHFPFLQTFPRATRSTAAGGATETATAAPAGHIPAAVPAEDTTPAAQASPPASSAQTSSTASSARVRSRPIPAWNNRDHPGGWRGRAARHRLDVGQRAAAKRRRPGRAKHHAHC